MTRKDFYEFGPYRADLDQRILLRNGEIVRLTPKAFDVLVALLDNHGKIISRQALLDKVWGTTTFIEEGSLNFQINALRAVLGDSSKSPQFIQAFPKRGYKFIAEVRYVADGSESATLDAAGVIAGTVQPEELASEEFVETADFVQPNLNTNKVNPDFQSATDQQTPGEMGAAAFGSLFRLARAKRVVFLAVAVIASVLAVIDAVWLRTPRIAWPVDLVLLAIAIGSVYAYRRLLRPKIKPRPTLTETAAFRGLLPFDRSDAGRFYGRDIDTAALFDLVTHTDFRFGVLYGDSGAGKSSLIRAGLLPKLNGAGFAAVYCRSFRDPKATLMAECEQEIRISPAQAEDPVDYLRRVAESSPGGLVVIFDQFEEFFINFKMRESRMEFTSLVADCFYETGLQVRFLFGIRSDFLHLAASAFDEQIPETLATSRRYHLRHFDEQQAADVIEKSVRRANWRFEAGLSQKVACDLAVNNTVLPSELQIVGEQLQSKRIFTSEAYDRAGAKEQLVHGYLEDAIEETGDKETAHLLLRSLISEEDTRLALPLSEIVKHVQRSQHAVERVLNLFIDKRLLRITQDDQPWRYELMHEHLIQLINQITGRVMDARQRANRLFRQYLSNYVFDRRTRIPLRRVYFIRSYSDIPRGSREKELLAKSVRGGLIRSIALLLSLIVTMFVAVAAFSIREEWEFKRLRDGHTAAVRRAEFSPDGKLLVSGGEDSAIIVWDFVRRQRLATLTVQGGWISALAFSPDGKWFATGSSNQKVIVWDAVTFEKVKTLDDPPALVGGLSFSPDGRFLASVSSMSRGRTIMWSAGRWEKLWEHPFGVGEHFAILFSKDNRLIIPRAEKCWNSMTGQEVPSGFDEGWGGVWAAILPDDKYLVSLNWDGYVKFVDLTTGKLIKRIRAHQDNGRAVAASPDGKIVATGAENIALWDTATKEKIVRFTDQPSAVWSLAFSPDGRWVVSTHSDGSIIVWDVVEHERVANLNEHSAPVGAVAFSRDGKVIATASEDRSIILWNVNDGRKKSVLLGHQNRVTGIAFSPDGSRLYSSDQSQSVVCWDLEQSKPLWTQTTQYGGYFLALSPDGRWLSTGPRTVLNTQDGRQDSMSDRLLAPNETWGVALSGDSRKLVFHNGRNLVMWDRLKQEVVQSLPTEKRPVNFSSSPDGKSFVSGDNEGTVSLWQFEPLQWVADLGRHSARVKSVAFSPDGEEVASAGYDTTVALWDVKRRRLKTYIGTHAEPVISVAFSPDGKRLVCGTHDNKIRIYTRHKVLWGYQVDWLPDLW